MTLQPLKITNGLGGAPDEIEILASGKDGWSIPTTITVDHPETATNVFVSSTLGMEVNDLMIAFEPGKDCTVFQITGIPSGNVQIHHQNTSLYNPPGGSNIFPTGGYGVGAILFNLGQMIQHNYSLSDSSNDLLVSEFVTASGVPATAVPLVPDIINLQAQYGFDARVGVQTDRQVSTWKDTMFDADGSGVTGDAGDIARIFAVRIAVVARSGQQEREVDPVSGLCNTTPTAPTWVGGSIDVSKNPDGSANPNWKCFRYKTFETVIPLRNLIWRQT
jgi:type IV pilus assembly protein PilW